MSKLILKSTADGACHLYFDNPNVEGFQKLGQGEHFKEHRKEQFISLFNDDARTLYGIMHDEVFQVRLPFDAKVEFVDNVCIFEKEIKWQFIDENTRHRKQLWSTIKFDRGAWDVLLLGEKSEKFLSGPDSIQYGKIIWTYFRKKVDGYIELSHFIDGQLVTLGRYSKVWDTRSSRKIIAVRPDGNYDIFEPNSTAPLKGRKGEAFESQEDVFMWSENEQKWIFFENSYLGARNALIKKPNGPCDAYMELYRIEDETLSLVAKGTGRWRAKHNKSELCINEIIYTRDYDTKLVDFDNPRPTLKKLIKDFFKRN